MLGILGLGLRIEHNPMNCVVDELHALGNTKPDRDPNGDTDPFGNLPEKGNL